MWRAAEAALPERFRKVRVTVTTSEREVRQAVVPPRLKVESQVWGVAGVTPEAFARLTRGKLEEGRGLSGSENEAVVSRSFARARGVRVGGELVLAGARFRVVGIAVGSSVLPADVYLPLRAAQKLAGVPGRVNAAWVRLESNARAEAERQHLARALPGMVSLGDEELGSQVARSLQGLASAVEAFAAGAAGVAAAGAVLAAAVMALTSVERRVHELGVLRALGWPGSALGVMLLAAYALQGLVGGALGLAAASALLQAAGEVAVELPAWVGPAGFWSLGIPALSEAQRLVLDLRVSPRLAGTALAVAWAAGALAGLPALWRALRIPPAEALRRGG